jgi:hypothetical protein
MNWVDLKVRQACRLPFAVSAKGGRDACPTLIGFVLSILLLAAATVPAEVTLPSQFSDHMVLQRDRKVPVWGTAGRP